MKCSSLLLLFVSFSINLNNVFTQEGECPPINLWEPVFLPHPWNCSKFVLCNWGYYFPMDCPQGLEWHAERKMCDHPEVGGCKLKIPEETQPTENIYE